MAITDSLISYWKIDETTGTTRNDSHGTNHLSSSGTTTQIQGKIRLINSATFGSGINISAVPSGHLFREDNASLSTGDIDFSVGGWFWFNSKNKTRYGLVGKWRSDNNQREYVLDYDNTVDRLRFVVSNNGTATTAVTASNFGAVPTGQWIFVMCWHDSVGNTINIRVNGGTANSAAHTTGVFNSTSAFRISRATIGGIAVPFHGKSDGVGFWKKVLTTAEYDEIYSDGFGKEYPWGYREDRRKIKPLGGGDYTSLQDWQSTEKRDIVKSNVISLAEVYPGGNASNNSALLLDGWTTDRTRYIFIRASESGRHNGRGRPYDLNYSYVRSSGELYTVQNRARDFRTEGMQYIKVSSTGNFSAFFQDASLGTSAHQLIMDKCIVVLESTGSNGALRVLGGGEALEEGTAQANIVKNTLILSRSPAIAIGAAQCVRVSAGNNGITRFHHCTILNVGSGHAISTDSITGHVVQSRNSYLKRGGTQNCYNGLAANFLKGGADATVNNEALHATKKLVLFNNTNFVDTTVGQENVHILKNTVLYRGADNTTQQAFKSSSKEFLTLDDWEYDIRAFASGRFQPITGSGGAFDIGVDQIPNEISASIGGLELTVNPDPISGFIGGLFSSDGIRVPVASIGGLILSKAIFDKQKVGIIGGLARCHAFEKPGSIGALAHALIFIGKPSGVIGGLGSGIFAFGPNSIGAIVLSESDCKQFVETHGRTLVKVRSKDVIDQDLNIDCVVMLKGVSNKDFNGRFIIKSTAASDFNAKFKVERHKRPPIVQILSVTPQSGILGPNGCRKVIVVASGTLRDGKEWVNAQIDFGEPLTETSPKTFTHNASISGFNTPPIWSGYHDYCVSGKYIITARGEDNFGMVGMDEFHLNLASGLPSNMMPNISISGTPRFGEVPVSVQVDFTTLSNGIPPNSALGVNSDRRILWAFGNRESSQKTNPTTFYQSPGDYIIVLRYLYSYLDGKKVWVSDSLRLGYNV